MRIAYVTAYDARDVNSWSGLCYFIWRSLAARGIEVELIGPPLLPVWVRMMINLKRRYYKRLRRGVYWSDGDLMTVRAWSLAAGRKLTQIPPVDAVLSATIFPVAFLPGHLPLITYSDSTSKGLFDTYPGHFNMVKENYRYARKIELSAQRRASALIYCNRSRPLFLAIGR